MSQLGFGAGSQRGSTSSAVTFPGFGIGCQFGGLVLGQSLGGLVAVRAFGAVLQFGAASYRVWRSTLGFRLGVWCLVTATREFGVGPQFEALVLGHKLALGAWSQLGGLAG